MADRSDIRLGFGSAIRSRRHELGLTQEELAHRIDLSRNYVGSVERGEQNIGLESVAALSEGLELSLAELFRRVERFLE